jgi:catechol 2,3-dioxygenase-like lactoylglutathione lyase family enzyme
MPSLYRFDHLHLVSADPQAAARYFREMFDARVTESLPAGEKQRIDVKLEGMTILIVPATPEENLPGTPPGRYRGLDHFGLQVNNLEEAAAELKRRGAEFVSEPRIARPGVKMAFIRGPENIRIELVERA